MHLIGLERYGVDPSEVANLGDVKIRCHGSLREPPLKSIIEFSPKERNVRISSFFDSNAQEVISKWPGAQIHFGKDIKRSFNGDLLAKDFPKVLMISEVESLWIDRIEGRRKSKMRKQLSYFSVLGKVALQVEGQSKGIQTVENRIVLVKAYSSDDAVKRLEKEWEEYSSPYLNHLGELVRWQLEEIVDVYELSSTEIDPKGTEVYSQLYNRRMKPNYEWHPRSSIKE